MNPGLRKAIPRLTPSRRRRLILIATDYKASAFGWALNKRNVGVYCHEQPRLIYNGIFDHTTE